MSLANMKEYGRRYTQEVLIVVMGIVILLLAFKTYEQTKDLSSANALIEATNSQLVISKNKAGLLVAKNIALETASAKDFLQLQSKDEVIGRLQSLVRDYKSKLNKQGSATTIDTEGSIDIKISTISIVDTTKVKPGECPSPTYNSSFNLDNWVEGVISAGKDSTGIKLVFREEADVIIGRDKTGFLGWGKGKPFSEVILHNPYNKVSVLKTYQVKMPPRKYWHLGVGVFYGVGSGFTPQVFMGAGLMWTPISF